MTLTAAPLFSPLSFTQTDMFKPALEEFKFSEEQLKQMGVITPAQSAEGIVNHIDSERHVQGMLDASVGKEQAMILF